MTLSSSDSSLGKADLNTVVLALPYDPYVLIPPNVFLFFTILSSFSSEELEWECFLFDWNFGKISEAVGSVSRDLELIRSAVL